MSNQYREIKAERRRHSFQHIAVEEEGHGKKWERSDGMSLETALYKGFGTPQQSRV